MNVFNKVFAILLKNNPVPKTELFFTNDFTLLIAIILSAQMTDKGVNAVTYDFFKTYNTPDDIFKLSIDELSEKLNKINFYKTKSRHILSLSKLVLKSGIPDNLDDLMKLPGVGRKTASVFLNILHKAPTIGVDTHVARVSKRLGITNSKNVMQVEKDILNKVDLKYHKHINHLLVLHGRYVCKALKPKCNECIINKHCQYNINEKR